MGFRFFWGFLCLFFTAQHVSARDSSHCFSALRASSQTIARFNTTTRRLTNLVEVQMELERRKIFLRPGVSQKEEWSKVFLSDLFWTDHELSRLQRYLKHKRIMDVVFALGATIPAGVLGVAVALLIKAEGIFDKSARGPIFYMEERVGFLGEPFTILKFRTMRERAEAGSSFSLKDDPRITRVGKIIRKLKLDEIPQLWNVYRGEMSFVGPRPTNLRDNAGCYAFANLFGLRYILPPGITSEAQIRLGSAGPTDEQYDRFLRELYAQKHFSLWEDVKVIALTLKRVMLGRASCGH